MQEVGGREMALPHFPRRRRHRHRQVDLRASSRRVEVLQPQIGVKVVVQSRLTARRPCRRKIEPMTELLRKARKASRGHAKLVCVSRVISIRFRSPRRA